MQQALYPAAPHRYDALPAAGIAPVAGWSLHYWDESTCNRYPLTEWVARRDGCDDIHLNVSRFRFTATQARFAWLVGAGFPHKVPGASPIGPIDDDDIDAAIAALALGLAA